MNLLISLVSVSSMTLISRLLGFARDILIASTFGVSIFTDSFFIAFKIPNLLRKIFCDTALSQSVIPILMEYKRKRLENSTKIFIASVSGFIIFAVCICIIVLFFFSDILILMIAPGFNQFPEQLVLSSKLLHIMLPYILLVSLSSLFSSILNSWNYFFISSISSIFLNLSIIVCSYFFSAFFQPSILVLSWSIILGGVFQLLYHFPFLSHIKMLSFPKINFYNKGLLVFLKKIMPSIIGSLVSQISLIMNTIFCSLLDAGSISWMYYADRLVEFPVGIIGVSLSTILFTSLSNSYQNGIQEECKRLLHWGFQIGLIIAIPSALIIYFLSQPIITVLFQYKKFTYLDVLMTQKALKLYAFGLISFILVKILSSAFYAFGKIHIPIRISIFTFFLTQLMNPFLIFYFRHAGLALSASISGWIHFILLYWKLHKNNLINIKKKDIIFFIHLCLSTFFMVLVTFCLLYFMPQWNIGSFFCKITRLFCVLFVAGVGYFAALKFFNISLLSFSYKIKKI